MRYVDRQRSDVHYYLDTHTQPFEHRQHAHFLELGVIRTYEFMSSLRRMSVVVKRLKSSSMEIYVKGAPEVMGEICNKESCTLYNHMLVHFD